MAEQSGTRRLLAPAKINLSLRVLGRRPDGYHELVSQVAFADLHDRITVTFDRDGGEDALSLQGPFASTLGSENLVLRAVASFRMLFPDLPALDIALEKRIPVAAGLGGGSADAAAILRFLAGWAECDPMAPEIREIAGALGADVPVCLESRSRVMRGTGTELDPPAAHFAERPVLLVNPGVAVPTGAVFRALAAGPVSGNPTEMGQEEERNDLEAPARSVAPEVGTVLDFLRGRAPPRDVRLSGSGATCFALFPDTASRDRAAAKLAAAHPEWWLHAGSLRDWRMPELDLPV